MIAVKEQKINVLDPFGASVIRDYSRLFQEFGLERIDEKLIARMKELGIEISVFIRRGIDFAHRDFDKVLDAYERGEPIAILSGIKPSNVFHLGTKITAEKIIYFQHAFKARVFYCIADLEALVDNQIPLEKAKEIAIDNVADLLALGLDANNAYIYFQSREKRVTNLAYLFSRKVTLNTLRSLYGERNLGLYFAALTQAGDILLPQLKDFDGKKVVLVPVGIDQDPHIRLTRDLVAKVRELYDFLPPAAIYHKLSRSLTGEAKMSKRSPMGMISLNDELELVERKIKLALDAGGGTAVEHRERGGRPELCPVFELLKFHFLYDDSKLREFEERCKSGELLCGECKEKVAEIAVRYLKEHQKRKRKLMDKAREIIENSWR